jgi:tetratricopeptide (TPR) repeat protein
MRCPNCQAENPDAAVVCKKCGASLELPTPPTDDERSRQFLEEAFRLSDEGKLGQAITNCKRAIEANPRSTSAYSLLGILYERLGRRELAIQAYEAVLRLSPDSTADRESLEQLLSRPELPPLEVAVPVAPPEREAPPPAPTPPAPVRRRGVPPMWYGVAALVVILVVLLVFTVRAWRAASLQSRAAAPARPAEPAPTPAAAPAPASPTASAMLAAPPPAPVGAVPIVPTGPIRVSPPPSAIPPTPEAPTPPPSRQTGPVVEMRIPTPEAFILRTASPPEPKPAPAYREPALAAEPTPEGARTRYFQGDLAGAIGTYEAVTAGNDRASAVTYQEMGWLYYQAGRRNDAEAAYRESLARYQRQLAAGEDADAARHGVRTAEAALRVMELK